MPLPAADIPQEILDAEPAPDLSRAAGWAKTFIKSDTNLAQRASHETDLAAYAQQLHDAKVAHYNESLQNNAGARALYIAEMNHNAQVARDAEAARQHLIVNQHANDTLSRQQSADAARQNAEKATSDHKLAMETEAHTQIADFRAAQNRAAGDGGYGQPDYHAGVVEAANSVTNPMAIASLKDEISHSRSEHQKNLTRKAEADAAAAQGLTVSEQMSNGGIIYKKPAPATPAPKIPESASARYAKLQGDIVQHEFEQAKARSQNGASAIYKDASKLAAAKREIAVLQNTHPGLKASGLLATDDAAANSPLTPSELARLKVIDEESQRGGKPPVTAETRPIFKDSAGNRAYKNADGTYEEIK